MMRRNIHLFTSADRSQLLARKTVLRVARPTGLALEASAAPPAFACAR
jgi:hypothetical protein